MNHFRLRRKVINGKGRIALLTVILCWFSSIVLKYLNLLVFGNVDRLYFKEKKNLHTILEPKTNVARPGR